ncbi:MAG: hormogonium polysaccharide biosynthesis glycosyltransferase HpsN [Cyanobacteria bacterium P01_A01_bin.84]
MDLPFISVVIPTYGREEALRDSIVDILKQDYPKFEVLVVDQTAEHKPEIQAFLSEQAATDTIKLHKLNWASLPGARNYAVRRCIGDVILFIDDDIQSEPGLLAAHAKNYVENPEIGAVAGRVFDRMKMADSAQGRTQGDASYKTIEYLPPQAMDPGIAWYYIDLVNTVKPQQVLTARGCNMSFRREIFYKHGLKFDERFRGSAVREESDFCLRIRQTGYKIWYDPEASLVHLGEETGGCHDISMRSLKYQMTFYHNHFLMGLKNLSAGQALRLYARLFDCHVLGRPPCHKSGSPIKVLTRSIFYTLGFLKALGTYIQSMWNDGQIYSRLDPQVKGT